MIDIPTLIRDHADQLLADVYPVTSAEAIGLAGAAPIDARLDRRSTTPRRTLLLAAAAVVLLALIAAAVTVFDSDGDEGGYATDDQPRVRALDAIAAFQSVVYSADGGLEGVGATTLDGAAWRAELGIDPAQVESSAATFDPSEITIVLTGTFSADDIDAAARSDENWSDALTVGEHRGVTFYSWLEDGRIEVVRPSVLFPASRRLALIDDLVIVTRTTADMTAAIDAALGAAPSLGDLPQVRALVAAMSAERATFVVAGIADPPGLFSGSATSPIDPTAAGALLPVSYYAVGDGRSVEEARDRIAAAIEDARAVAEEAYPDGGVADLVVDVEPRGRLIRLGLPSAADEVGATFGRQVIIHIERDLTSDDDGRPDGAGAPEAAGADVPSDPPPRLVGRSVRW